MAILLLQCVWLLSMLAVDIYFSKRPPPVGVAYTAASRLHSLAWLGRQLELAYCMLSILCKRGPSWRMDTNFQQSEKSKPFKNPIFTHPTYITSVGSYGSTYNCSVMSTCTLKSANFPTAKLVQD